MFGQIQIIVGADQQSQRRGISVNNSLLRPAKAAEAIIKSLLDLIKTQTILFFPN